MSELVVELSEAKETFRALNTSTKKLDHIWNIQKSTHDKKGLGYEETTKIHETKFTLATQGSTTTIKIENSKNTQVVKQVKKQGYVSPNSVNFVMKCSNANTIGSNDRRLNG